MKKLKQIVLPRIKKNSTQQQAFFFTLINYFGITIGIISTLFIYPKNKELIGLYRYIEGIAHIFYPIFVLGASQALVNYYPKLNYYFRRKLFLYSLTSIFLISFVAFLLLIILYFTTNFKLEKYLFFAFPIAVFLAYIELFKKKSAIIQKITWPTFFDNIIPKIALPIIFLLVLKNIITVEKSMYYYVFSYGIIFILISLYLRRYLISITNFNFNELFVTIDKSKYYKFSFYAFAGSLGSVFAFRIDAIMIPLFLSLTDNGTFSIGVTLASALAIPANGVFTVYAPIISDYLKNNKLDALNQKYKSVSKLLFFIGGILFGSIVLGIQNLFLLLPTSANLMATIPIIFILGTNVLINMATGFNGEIITYSKHFRFNLIAIVVLIVLNISLNVLFLHFLNLGLVWVAVASLISMVVFNASKLIFIYKKFKLFPFDLSFLKVGIIMISVFLVLYFIPNNVSNIINLLAKVGLYIIVCCSIIYKLKLISEFNLLFTKR